MERMNYVATEKEHFYAIQLKDNRQKVKKHSNVQVFISKQKNTIQLNTNFYIFFT